jgi:hypothetical protein
MLSCTTCDLALQDAIAETISGTLLAALVGPLVLLVIVVATLDRAAAP